MHLSVGARPDVAMEEICGYTVSKKRSLFVTHKHTHTQVYSRGAFFSVAAERIDDVCLGVVKADRETVV